MKLSEAILKAFENENVVHSTNGSFLRETEEGLIEACPLALGLIGATSTEVAKNIAVYEDTTQQEAEKRAELGAEIIDNLFHLKNKDILDIIRWSDIDGLSISTIIERLKVMGL